MKKKAFSKWIVSFLAIVIVISMLPVTVFAQSTDAKKVALVVEKFTWIKGITRSLYG